MSAFSRNKGKRGEREVCALIRDLLGFEASRRVRQHDGDSDVLGVPGWCIEVKNCANLRIAEWWRQTVEQSCGGDVPALFYKLPRRGWRVLWPLSCLLTVQRAEFWSDIAYAVDTTPEAWAAVVREILGSMPVADREYGLAETKRRARTACWYARARKNAAAARFGPVTPCLAT